MKILQVITSLRIGGAEKLLVDIAPRLKKRGIICDVLVLIDYETAFKKELEEQGIRIFGISKKMSTYNPFHILKIMPYLKHYDLVHVHLFQPQYWTAFAKWISFSKTPIITTEHNTTNRRRNIKLLHAVDKLVYTAYKTIIAISVPVKKELEDYLGLKPKIILLLNGIDTVKFNTAYPANRNELGLNDTDYILTMVAGFRQQKDQDTLIRTMQYLPQDVKLLLVGDGVRRKKCETIANTEEVSNRVIFTGLRNDVSGILKTSDIVIMSSHFEGVSLSALEGMTACKPFIASDVPGLKEITEGAGLLFQEGNSEELAKVILSLKNNSHYAQNVATSCYERAKTYDIETMVNNLVMIYEENIISN